MIDVLIRESDYAQPAAFEDRVSFVIGLALEFVDGAIDFDDQAARVAIEVDDEAVNNLLTPEMKPTQFIGAQLRPQASLTGRHPRPKIFRPLGLGIVESLAFNDSTSGAHSHFVTPYLSE